MDFIERWFHVSPDSGDGSLETLIVIALAAVVWVLLRKFRRPDLESEHTPAWRHAARLTRRAR